MHRHQLLTTVIALALAACVAPRGRRQAAGWPVRKATPWVQVAGMTTTRVRWRATVAAGVGAVATSGVWGCERRRPRASRFRATQKPSSGTRRADHAKSNNLFAQRRCD